MRIVMAANEKVTLIQNKVLDLSTLVINHLITNHQLKNLENVLENDMLAMKVFLTNHLLS